MNIYKKDFSVSYKGTNDPVTEADQQANTLIVKGLMTAFPDDQVVAEESPLPLEVQAAGRVWYVDPLDGTKEFISRNGEFSIMIGLTLLMPKRSWESFFGPQKTSYLQASRTKKPGWSIRAHAHPIKGDADQISSSLIHRRFPLPSISTSFGH